MNLLERKNAELTDIVLFRMFNIDMGDALDNRSLIGKPLWTVRLSPVNKKISQVRDLTRTPEERKMAVDALRAFYETAKDGETPFEEIENTTLASFACIESMKRKAWASIQ